MRLAILSDIHDNVWRLQQALAAVRHCDLLLCCGDLCSPFIIDELTRGFGRGVHIVFGNNDADTYRITAKALASGRVHVHGEFFEQEFSGRKLAMNHFDSLARPLADSGRYDVVCFGHNHQYEIARSGNCLLLNPGPVMGAAFGPAGRTDVASTFLILDTETGIALGYEIDPASGDARPRAAAPGAVAGGSGDPAVTS